jgi:NTE family protein
MGTTADDDQQEVAARLRAPVQDDERDSRPPEPGVALCLSGGGYRAMLFHVGVLWRLYEIGHLATVQRVSSVSGGSITAGVLAIAWPRLSFEPARLAQDFVPLVVAPLRTLGSRTLDANAIIGGIFLPGSIADHVAAAYRRHLFGEATLQDLPDLPRFVINATNVQSGALWRFSKPYMRDWRVGMVEKPNVTLAAAVAASSAFPPVLSPMTLSLDPAHFVPGSGANLQQEPYTSHVVLTDGGVYDNLGLETAWKRYQTILVSDAGGLTAPEEEPHTDWARHAYRILNLVDHQVRNLRKRQVVSSFVAGTRNGAYWGIRVDIQRYALASALPCPFDRTTELANIPTRLERMPDQLQERLINWGYAVADAAVRTHVDTALPQPAGFPYPGSAV